MSLAMMRPIGMLLLLPLFKGGAMGTALVRNGLVIIFAFPAIPKLMDMQPYLLEANYLELIGLYLKEFSIGLIIGFCAAVPFWAIDMSGFLIDTMRGSSLSTVLNPLLGAESSIYGIFFTQVLSAIFLASGGMNFLLSGMYHSYTILPPGEGFFLANNSAFFEFIMNEWRFMNALFMGFSMPAMVIMLLTDTAFGLVNRSAQQLNVFFLSMPVKSVMILLLMIYSLNFAFTNYLERTNAAESHFQVLFHILESSD
ncbi:EscT/YscT/HrcT family type III secretion system export apparatus protein [Parashewanella spongiae]|uniref:EscT/YscT/HrcT family type III secretion system export apparatus protein n=2 Tax=Parashewanella spongiae TaxID=342950 RepID=A0A3A6UJG8_9GAMM|nr:EscT/YscT/HrcT family type III secretion system export apparatus protein [Parashewanella spongiae]